MEEVKNNENYSIPIYENGVKTEWTIDGVVGDDKYFELLKHGNGKDLPDMVNVGVSKRYIAKKDTWFKEGTECKLLEDYQEAGGLYSGIYIVGENKGYDTFWHNKGYKEGDEVEMNEVCSHDEFYNK